MYVDCERCGERTERIETATRSFCPRCASTASTGARASSELLFSLRPLRPRESVEDLAALTTPDERVSFAPLITLAVGPPRVDAPASSRARLAAWSLVSIGALLLVGSVALAWRAQRTREASSLERAAEVVSPAREVAPTTNHADPEGEIADVPAPPPRDPEPSVDLHERESVVPEVIELARPATPRPRRLAARPIEPTRPIFDEPRVLPSQPSVARLPSRTAVNGAMSTVRDRVTRCGDGSHGMVEARVTFLGESGRAVHAEVVDASVPPAVRSCVARALRDAELPVFGQDRFVVHYPYRL